MKLGVNVIRLTRDFTGVGRYIECILDQWARSDQPFDEIRLYTHTPLVASKVLFPLEKFEQRVIGSRVPDPIWEGTALRTCVDEVDVLFAPSYTIPIGWTGKVLVTNHGPAEFPIGSYGWFRSLAYERLYRFSARKADFVCASSKSVKDRIVSAYDIPPEKVFVTYLAASDIFEPIDDPALLRSSRERYVGGEEPYILFVGKLAGRHYIPNLLKAFERLKRVDHLPHRLVLVGPDYTQLDVPKRAVALGIADSVSHVPYVEHTALPPLYSGAEVFVFPASEAEGFGIPVVEAMACGTPVVTVGQGSLREIAPGASLLAATPSTDDLYAALRTVSTQPQLRAELRIAGLERAKSFRWSVTAERTMKLLWGLANG
jgi:glycosyltransferase involved in cell wall biosynthesis